MMFTLFIIALVGTVSADLLYEGQCPDVTPVENFDLNAYEGTWYEVAMLPLYNQMNGKCSTSVCKVEGDGLSVRNLHVINGVQQYLDGTIKFADESTKSGKLVYSFKIGERTRIVETNILAIDYKNYAIAYSCRYDESKKSHYTFAWVLSRSKTLEGATKSAVEDFLQNHTNIIDSSKLIPTDFSDEGCSFSSSYAVTGPKKH